MTVVALLATTVGATASAVLPAFPGAEGAGALSVGGRGGKVCRVTNLNDSGLGSLRECVNVKGPRIVIFEVGGTIKLRSRLFITEPYLTIAGQTAPGGGIQLKADKSVTDWGNSPPGELRIHNTHDIVIRYLRIRPGLTGTDASPDGIRVAENSHDIIIDHTSIAWAREQNWSLASRTSAGAPRNITLQNSIITEMVDGRVNSLMIGSHHEITTMMTNVDLHNNYMANASHRNPSAQHKSGRFVNNIFYNWDSWASRSIGGVEHDWISNLWKPGPSSFRDSRAVNELQFGQVYEWSNERRIRGQPSVYVQGNRGLRSGMDPDKHNLPYTREFGEYINGRWEIDPNHQVKGATPIEWERYKPLPPTSIPITIRHVDELEDRLLPIVGASKRLDCAGNWVSNRDAVDERVIAEYLNNEGTRTKGGQGEEIYGGHLVLASGAPCLDSSGDGIPDEWAIAKGLDPTDATLGAKVHESGYTFLEMYLNGMEIGLAPPGRMQIIVE